jgi:hypothetical protein
MTEPAEWTSHRQFGSLVRDRHRAVLVRAFLLLFLASVAAAAVGNANQTSAAAAPSEDPSASAAASVPADPSSATDASPFPVDPRPSIEAHFRIEEIFPTHGGADPIITNTGNVFLYVEWVLEFDPPASEWSCEPAAHTDLRPGEFVDIITCGWRFAELHGVCDPLTSLSHGRAYWGPDVGPGTGPGEAAGSFDFEFTPTSFGVGVSGVPCPSPATPSPQPGSPGQPAPTTPENGGVGEGVPTLPPTDTDS